MYTIRNKEHSIIITRITDFKTRNCKNKQHDIFSFKYTIDLPSLHDLCKFDTVTNVLPKLEFCKTHSRSNNNCSIDFHGHCCLIMNPSAKIFWKVSKICRKMKYISINIKQLTIIQLNTTTDLQLNEL